MSRWKFAVVAFLFFAVPFAQSEKRFAGMEFDQAGGAHRSGGGYSSRVGSPRNSYPSTVNSGYSGGYSNGPSSAYGGGIYDRYPGDMNRPAYDPAQPRPVGERAYQIGDETVPVGAAGYRVIDGKVYFQLVSTAMPATYSKKYVDETIAKGSKFTEPVATQEDAKVFDLAMEDLFPEGRIWRHPIPAPANCALVFHRISGGRIEVSSKNEPDSVIATFQRISSAACIGETFAVLAHEFVPSDALGVETMSNSQAPLFFLLNGAELIHAQPHVFEPWRKVLAAGAEDKAQILLYSSKKGEAPWVFDRKGGLLHSFLAAPEGCEKYQFRRSGFSTISFFLTSGSRRIETRLPRSFLCEGDVIATVHQPLDDQFQTLIYRGNDALLEESSDAGFGKDVQSTGNAVLPFRIFDYALKDRALSGVRDVDAAGKTIPLTLPLSEKCEQFQLRPLSAELTSLHYKDSSDKDFAQVGVIKNLSGIACSKGSVALLANDLSNVEETEVAARISSVSQRDSATLFLISAGKLLARYQHSTYDLAKVYFENGFYRLRLKAVNDENVPPFSLVLSTDGAWLKSGSATALIPDAAERIEGWGYIRAAVAKFKPSVALRFMEEDDTNWEFPDAFIEGLKSKNDYFAKYRSLFLFGKSISQAEFDKFASQEIWNGYCSTWDAAEANYNAKLKIFNDGPTGRYFSTPPRSHDTGREWAPASTQAPFPGMRAGDFHTFFYQSLRSRDSKIPPTNKWSGYRMRQVPAPNSEQPALVVESYWPYYLKGTGPLDLFGVKEYCVFKKALTAAEL